MRKGSTQHQFTTSNVAYIKKLTISLAKKIDTCPVMFNAYNPLSWSS